MPQKGHFPIPIVKTVLHAASQQGSLSPTDLAKFASSQPWTQIISQTNNQNKLSRHSGGMEIDVIEANNT